MENFALIMKIHGDIITALEWRGGGSSMVRSAMRESTKKMLTKMFLLETIQTTILIDYQQT